jgi:hypothetical protein
LREREEKIPRTRRKKKETLEEMKKKKTKNKKMRSTDWPVNQTKFNIYIVI